jgi:tetratricopeptide (TPR) repeat protein
LGGQKQHEAAEKIFRRVLEIRERILAKEDPDTLRTINLIGTALHAQEEYAAAEEMYRRALEGRRTMLGIEHPLTLWSMNDLALLFYDQGEDEAADEMYQRVLEGLHTIIDKDHLDAAQSAKSFEGALRNEEGYDGEMYWQARKVLKEVLDGRLTL